MLGQHLFSLTVYLGSLEGVCYTPLQSGYKIDEKMVLYNAGERVQRCCHDIH